jgi:hypothetical protein
MRWRDRVGGALARCTRDSARGEDAGMQEKERGGESLLDAHRGFVTWALEQYLHSVESGLPELLEEATRPLNGYDGY